jgi:mRNA-degrading endonuclease RelE of RelBE toxin-antitoxin system
MKERVEFTSSALRALAGMGKVERKFLLESITLHLIESDPGEATRNKFPLKRPSQHAERELRLDSWRVFYMMRDDGARVLVTLISEKRGSKLVIEGEEFEL